MVTHCPRFPRQGEWTYQDWLNFPDDGWTYEIIDGVLYMAPPSAIAHQDASIELAARMRIYASEHELGKVLEAPCGVRLPDQPVPLQPDIFFVRKERLHIIGKNYVEGRPDLVVEILSPSNIQYDRDTKFNIYQQTGVPEYWLVDYQARTVEIFTLTGDGYHLAGKYKGQAVAASRQLSGFQVVVASLF